MDKEIAGIAALYAVIELVKFAANIMKDKRECILSNDNQKKLDDLHEWHNHTDDEGRKSWYVPKHLHSEQERIVEMLRNISMAQENTARVLAEILKTLDKK